MLVKIRTPKAIIQQLKQGQDVIARTDWENPYSPTAYHLLSKISGLSNFFFGVQLTDSVPSSEISNVLGSPNKPEHQYEITLNLDPSTVFAHDFYAFSGLILDCQEKSHNQKFKKIQAACISLKKNGPSK